MFKFLILTAMLTACGKPDAPNEDPQPTPDPTPVVTPGTFHTDEFIELSVGASAEFGTAGHIRIFKKDGTQVDDIDMADIASVTIREDGAMVPKEQLTDASKMNTFMDAIGSSKNYRRVVHYTPVRLEGGKAVIKPHSSVLDFDTEYYVTVDEGVFSGFKGVAKGEKEFKTVPAPANASELTVATSGTADFRTVQGALNFAMKNSGALTISIADGTYREMLYLRERANVTIKGKHRSSVKIVYPNNESYMNGSGGSASSVPAVGKTIGKNGGRSLFLVENCDNLRLEGITLENSFGELKGQAETIYFNSGSNKHHLYATDCAFRSLQDTFLCKGICHIKSCLVAGHCDYIWGYPSVCLFEDCEIRSLAKGYIVQARVPSVANKGFIFLNCKLTADTSVADDNVWLARSGGSSDYYDNVVYVNCTMCSAIRKAGWCTDNSKLPNPSTPSATAGWREYGSKDASGNAITSGRASCGKFLTAAEAAQYLDSRLILAE